MQRESGVDPIQQTDSDQHAAQPENSEYLIRLANDHLHRTPKRLWTQEGHEPFQNQKQRKCDYPFHTQRLLSSRRGFPEVLKELGIGIQKKDITIIGKGFAVSIKASVQRVKLRVRRVGFGVHSGRRGIT